MALDRIREVVRQKPWIGWAVVGGLCLIAAAAVAIQFTGGPPDNASLANEVTIRYEDTGTEVKIPRGRVEQTIWDRPLPLDPAQGLENPDTKKLTGFYPDRDDWKKMVEDIAEQRKR